MKKDIFNGKIKKGYVGYVLLGFLIPGILSLLLGALTIYACWEHGYTGGNLMIGLTFSVLFLLLGTAYPVLGVIVARSYPRFAWLRKKVFFNSDYYFVDCDERELHSKSRSRLGRRQAVIFNVVTSMTDLATAKEEEKEVLLKYAQSIYDCISTVPKGKVVSAAWVAERVGCYTRIVCWAIEQAKDETLPLHRVVDLDGGLLPEYPFGGILGQERALGKENVKINNSTVWMSRYQYRE